MANNEIRFKETILAGERCYECPIGKGEKLVQALHSVIRTAVRALAVLMCFVIVWGVLDVVWTLVEKMAEPPYLLLNISDILATFGSFLAVLIAIEIFLNIVLYLREDVIHVKLVLATALMAAARKVIVIDYDTHSPPFIAALGLVIAGLALAYWLVFRVEWRAAHDDKVDVEHNPNP